MGLFHSLIAQRKDIEAFDEMKRFTSEHPSDTYEQLGWDLLGRYRSTT